MNAPRSSRLVVEAHVGSPASSGLARSRCAARDHVAVSTLPLRPRAGFTLLEVLVSLALVGLLLVALNTFLFSMGELWGKGSDSRLFDQHVRTVSRFLERELRTAGLPPSVAVGSPGVTTEDIKAQSGLTDHLLTFELREGSRLLVWPERPLPDVVCSLALRNGGGLVLLWHSRLEKRFKDDPPRESLISPMVTAMAYDYYEVDFKRWQTETTLRRAKTGDGYETPQRLRLTFSHGKLSKESLISLPAALEGLPAF